MKAQCHACDAETFVPLTYQLGDPILCTDCFHSGRPVPEREPMPAVEAERRAIDRIERIEEMRRDEQAWRMERGY